MKRKDFIDLVLGCTDRSEGASSVDNSTLALVSSGGVVIRAVPWLVEQTVVLQKPYTFAMVLMRTDGGQERFGCGFSKVSHPDTWNAADGAEIALRRAAAMIWKAYYRGQPG